MGGIVLVGAVASLRDSLKRISELADDEAVAVRAVRNRIRCNRLRTRVLVRMQQGTLPDIPDALVQALFGAGGFVSAVDPDNVGQAMAALVTVEAALLETEGVLDIQMT